MLLENLVTRRVSEENVSNSSLTRRVTKRGHLFLEALAKVVIGVYLHPCVALRSQLLSIDCKQRVDLDANPRRDSHASSF